MVPERTTLLLQGSPAFSASRTQQTLFAQCVPALSASRTQQTLFVRCFPAFSPSRTQHTLFCQCFPTFSSFRTRQILLFECFPVFYAFWPTCAPPAPLHQRPSLWTLPESMKSRKTLKKYSLLCSGSRKIRNILNK